MFEFHRHEGKVIPRSIVLMSHPYLREAFLRLQVILALLLVSLGAYGVWSETRVEDPSFVRLGLAVATGSGGLLALLGILRLGRVVTVTGSLMGFAVGHPGYLLIPILLMMSVATEKLSSISWRTDNPHQESP